MILDISPSSCGITAPERANRHRVCRTPKRAISSIARGPSLLQRGQSGTHLGYVPSVKKSGPSPHRDLRRAGGVARSIACGKEPEKRRSRFALWRWGPEDPSCENAVCGRTCARRRKGVPGTAKVGTHPHCPLTAVRAQCSDACVARVWGNDVARRTHWILPDSSSMFPRTATAPQARSARGPIRVAYATYRGRRCTRSEAGRWA